jgi:hypothetical protein
MAISNERMRESERKIIVCDNRDCKRKKKLYVFFQSAFKHIAKLNAFADWVLNNTASFKPRKE